MIVEFEIGAGADMWQKIADQIQATYDEHQCMDVIFTGHCPSFSNDRSDDTQRQLKGHLWVGLDECLTRCRS